METTTCKDKDAIISGLASWLDTVTGWQEGIGIDNVLKQIEALPELIEWLNKLVKNLNSCDNVSDALEKFVNVGQLLGRLCSLPLILCRKDSFYALMTCILWFYVESPEAPVEAKAKSWAVTQLRNVLCHTQFSSAVLDVTGYTQQSLNQIWLDQVLDYIEKQLYGWTPPLWDVALGCSVLPPQSCQHEHFVPLARVCLGLIHLPKFCLMLHRLVLYLSRSQTKDVEGLADLYNDILRTCELKSTDETTSNTLTETQIVVCSIYLPGLEKTVLTLVCTLCQNPHMNNKQGLQLIVTSGLPRACVKHIHVYYTVDRIIRSLLIKSHHSPLLEKLIGWFQRCICQELGMSKLEPPPSLMLLYHRPFQPLVALLQVEPNAFPARTLEQHLSLISKCWKEVNSTVSDSFNLNDQYIFSLQFAHWQWVSSLVALFGDKEICGSCCEVILLMGKWRNQRVCIDLKTTLLDIVLSLRGLLFKTGLHWSDLQCATMISQKSATWLQVLTKQFLLLFLLSSLYGNTVSSSILSEVTGCSRPLCHLLNVLDTVDLLLEFRPVYPKQISGQLLAAEKLLTSLLHQVENTQNKVNHDLSLSQQTQDARPGHGACMSDAGQNECSHLGTKAVQDLIKRTNDTVTLLNNNRSYETCTAKR